MCSSSQLYLQPLPSVPQLGDTSLPVQQPEMVDDHLLKALHHVLLEVRESSSAIFPSLPDHVPKIHIEEGQMTCPNCSHVYPISNGIPNMVCSSTSSKNLSLTTPLSSLPNMRLHSETFGCIYIRFDCIYRPGALPTSLNLVGQVRSWSGLDQEL